MWRRVKNRPLWHISSVKVSHKGLILSSSKPEVFHKGLVLSSSTLKICHKGLFFTLLHTFFVNPLWNASLVPYLQNGGGPISIESLLITKRVCGLEWARQNQVPKVSTGPAMHTTMWNGNKHAMPQDHEDKSLLCFSTQTERVSSSSRIKTNWCYI